MIVKTYTVPGRTIPEATTKNSRQLSEALVAAGKKVTAIDSTSLVVSTVKNMLQPGDVAIIMGAGDIWRQAEEVAKHYD